ncbi:hypothetical protein HCJ07_08875 [Listeria booriae]|uniref:Uncharacterized protein n=1 Tax=Listeria booriae TaxID=1552123 RepID=A0A7X0XBH2_9LIST|nr:hypothetical protein [Listeria booriae]MBC1490661.1 hypothetical protein [Listeria booriae]MBC1503803.1 hypothetical protein [Listeria booriae]MBC1524754.1 hypothetical protein [Listeria booriae]MBC1530462.1 hypothetical protein [Listeria booriae]
MPHYEQVRHAISARKHSLESVVDGVKNRKNGMQDENHEIEEKMIHRLNQIEAEAKDMISYCEQTESALRREI